MKFHALDLALQAISELGPLLRRVRAHDRVLAKQITDAANSVVLNLGEGALSDPGTRKSRYQSAAGSASEVRAGLLAAVAWGHVSEARSAPVAERYDRVVAILYRLVHG